MDGLDDLDTRLLVDLLRDHSDPRKSLGQHYLIDDQVIDRTMDIPTRQLLDMLAMPRRARFCWSA